MQEKKFYEQQREREKMDTIVMGSRGLSTSSELLLGSRSHNALLAE